MKILKSPPPRKKHNKKVTNYIFSLCVTSLIPYTEVAAQSISPPTVLLSTVGNSFAFETLSLLIFLFPGLVGECYCQLRIKTEPNTMMSTKRTVSFSLLNLMIYTFLYTESKENHFFWYLNSVEETTHFLVYSSLVSVVLAHIYFCFSTIILPLQSKRKQEMVMEEPKETTGFHLNGWMVVKIVSMFILVYCSTGKIDYIFSSSNSATLRTIQSNQSFLSIPTESLQILGFGNSKMHSSFSPNQLYEEYGYIGYNLGNPSQRFNVTYYKFLKALEKQSPDIVLFEIKPVFEILENTSFELQLYGASNFRKSLSTLELLETCFDTNLDNYTSFFQPWYSFHSNWKELTKNNFIKTDFFLDQTKGFWTTSNVVPHEPVDYSSFAEKPLSEESLNILNNIVSICNDRNIEIIFYLAPYVGAFQYGDAVEAYSNENNIQFLNFFKLFDQLNLSWETDFRDKTHLNYDGAEKVTNFLGEYISQNYNLTDMRTVDEQNT